MLRRFWRTGLYALYTRRLRQQVLAGPLPEHVGMIMDGNRRWARQAGLASPSLGAPGRCRARGTGAVLV